MLVVVVVTVVWIIVPFGKVSFTTYVVVPPGIDEFELLLVLDLLK
jgi:hypothetical protein